MIKGSIRGAPTSTVIEKVWLLAQGLGDVAFAYPFSLILIEIQVCKHRLLWNLVHKLYRI